MTGRAQLVTHDDPAEPAARLQNTGFLALHQQDQLNQPIQGPQVPEPFTLTEAGTGVFIVAFDTRRYHDWAELTAQATVTQFFHAILSRHLVVTIGQQPDTTRTIAQDTLEIELDGLPPREPTRYYVQAIQEDTPQLTNPSGRLGQMGHLNLWISTAQGAPRRTAHVNRRGMLITQERRFSSNPFYPSGGTGWPHWCAVTMANDENADRFIRRLEPPAHDAIHYKQLRHPEDQRAAEAELRQQRDEITRMVKDRIQDTMKEATQNVEELANLFPDLPDLSQGTHDLKWRTKVTPETPDNAVNTAEDSDDADPQDDPDGDLEREGQSPPDSGGGGGPNTFTDLQTRRASPRPSETTMRDTRIMRTNPRELTMTFTMPPGDAHEVAFAINAAGEQYQKYERAIPLASVSREEDLLVSATLRGNQVVVQAPPDTPVTLRMALEASDEDYNSYSITQVQRTESQQ